MRQFLSSSHADDLERVQGQAFPDEAGKTRAEVQPKWLRARQASEDRMLVEARIRKKSRFHLIAVTNLDLEGRSADREFQGYW